jgi:protein TonB
MPGIRALIIWACTSQSLAFALAAQVPSDTSAGAMDTVFPLRADRSMIDPPVYVSGPSLAYPAAMRRKGIEGRVVIKLIVDTLGRADAKSIRVVSATDAGFIDAAIAAALEMKFRPARMKAPPRFAGRAVRMLVNVPVDFHLRSTHR